jgi:D-alanine-D-alanine ligase
MPANQVTQATDFGRVGLVIGGDSAEREVSLDGGRAVAASLRRNQIEFDIYDGVTDLFAAISAGRVSRVFNLLHGPGGEDGSLQGALELMQIPVTGSGVLGSALTMDKVRSKWVFQRCGIPTQDFVVLDSSDDARGVLADKFELPLFVKPVGQGSSVGITKVSQWQQLDGAVELARRYGRRVIVEPAVEGPEFFAGILQGQCLPLIRVETPHEFYDYAAKYESDETRYFCPCGLPPEQERDLQDLSLRAFDVLDAGGWGRVDFLLNENGEARFLEVNTTPGMTDHSLVPQAAAEAGIDFDELVWKILETSMVTNAAE